MRLAPSTARIVLAGVAALLVLALIACAGVLLGRWRDRPAATPAPTVPAAGLTPPAREAPASPEPIRVEGAPYRTPAEAVAAADAGATVTLGAGVYELGDTLVIDKPLTLVGAAMERTVVASRAPGAAVVFRGPGPFRVENITFSHVGEDAANVVEVEGGQFDCFRCRFTGAVWSEAEASGGVGLYLFGDARGTVSQSWAYANELYGIQVGGTAAPLIEGTVADGNDGDGISFWGNAAGMARGNRCSGNGVHGLAVNESARPALVANACSGNGDSGISFRDDAGGEARDNDCSSNGAYGVAVAGRARPLLQGNVCSGNDGAGIAYFDEAGGEARDNRSSDNRLHGIAVTGRATPLLVANNVADNDDSGIAYFDEASGGARDNTCSGNLAYDIYVAVSAGPRLTDNDCEGASYDAGAPERIPGPPPRPRATPQPR